MATAKADLRAKLSLDLDDFERGLKKGEQKAETFGHKVARIGKNAATGLGSAFSSLAAPAAAGGLVAALGVAGLAAATASGIKGALDLGGTLSDLKAATGGTASEIMTLQTAMEYSGLEGDGLLKVVAALQDALAGSADNTQKFADAQKELGTKSDEAREKLQKQRDDALKGVDTKFEAAWSDPKQRGSSELLDGYRKSRQEITDKYAEESKKLEKEISDQQAKVKYAPGIFERLGLDPKTMSADQPLEILDKVGAAFRNIDDQAKRMQLAKELFGGKMGPKMLTMLVDPTAFEHARKVLGKSAGIMDEKADAFDNISDFFGTTLPAKFKAFWIGVAEQVEPLLTRWTKALEGVDLTEWGQRYGKLLTDFADAFVKLVNGDDGQWASFRAQAKKAGEAFWDGAMSKVGQIPYGLTTGKGTPRGNLAADIADNDANYQAMSGTGALTRFALGFPLMGLDLANQVMGNFGPMFGDADAYPGYTYDTIFGGGKKGSYDALWTRGMQGIWNQTPLDRANHAMGLTPDAAAGLYAAPRAEPYKVPDAPKVGDDGKPLAVTSEQFQGILDRLDQLIPTVREGLA